MLTCFSVWAAEDGELRATGRKLVPLRVSPVKLLQFGSIPRSVASSNDDA